MRLQQLYAIIGFLAIISCCVTITLAIVESKQNFSPFDYWIEDYGMASENPGGAGFYDVGFTITGLLLAIFCLGFNTWKAHDTGHKAMRILGQAAGMIAGFALVLKGITLMLGLMSPTLWTLLFFLFVMIAVILITLFMMIRPGYHEDTICIGLTSVALITLLGVTLYLNAAPVITEWCAAFFLLVWLAFVSRDTYMIP